MKKIIYPEKKDWVEILRRPALNTDTLRDTVKEVLDKVKTEGDKAVREYEERFDKVKLDSLGVTETEIAEAEKEVPIELKAAIMLAQKNIHTFHNSQRFEGKKVQTVSGVTCWQKAVAIEKVGLYIPGGTAPLFSTVLMLATPAQIAGCKEIVLCTPPDKEGKVHPAILYAAKLVRNLGFGCIADERLAESQHATGMQDLILQTDQAHGHGVPAGQHCLSGLFLQASPVPSAGLGPPRGGDPSEYAAGDHFDRGGLLLRHCARGDRDQAGPCLFPLLTNRKVILPIQKM